MLLDDIADQLVVVGAGAIGTTLFKGRMPATPDTATSLMEYGGLGSIKAMNPLPGTAVLEQPNIQVMCRSTDYTTARNRAERAYKALDGFSGYINGIQYAWITANQPPFFVQRDQNDRVWIGFNCSVRKALSTTT